MLSINQISYAQKYRHDTLVDYSLGQRARAYHTPSGVYVVVDMDGEIIEAFRISYRLLLMLNQRQWPLKGVPWQKSMVRDADAIYIVKDDPPVKQHDPGFEFFNVFSSTVRDSEGYPTIGSQWTKVDTGVDYEVTKLIRRSKKSTACLIKLMRLGSFVSKDVYLETFNKIYIPSATKNKRDVK